MDRVNNFFDLIKIAHGTKQELIDNKDLLQPYEIVFANDTNQLGVKDEQGNLHLFNADEVV